MKDFICWIFSSDQAKSSDHLQYWRRWHEATATWFWIKSGIKQGWCLELPVARTMRAFPPLKVSSGKCAPRICQSDQIDRLYVNINHSYRWGYFSQILLASFYLVMADFFRVGWFYKCWSYEASYTLLTYYFLSTLVSTENPYFWEMPRHANTRERRQISAHISPQRRYHRHL